MKTKQARIWVSLVIMIMLVVATTPAAVRAISLDDSPAAPAEDNGINALWYVGEIDTPGHAFKVEVIGDIAYVADDDFGLRIIDVSEPTAPVELGAYETPNLDHIRHLDVVGEYAYVTDANYGFYIINISDPEFPTLVGSLNLSGEETGVAVAGIYAYINTYSYLRVVNISNPTAPYEVGSCPISIPQEITLSGSYAYIPRYYGGLSVVNVSNPLNPIEVGVYNSPAYAFRVDIEGDYAYLANSNSHLRIIDISNPAEPEEVAVYETPGDPVDVQVAWGFAYVADLTGVRVLDVADPASPFMVGSYPSTGPANCVDVDNGYIYVGNGAAGLLILRDSFSISGWVKDPAESPIEGVTITATGGGTTVTDATGAYGFSDVEPGTYTLTASKDGYNFTPDSREVTLPPNAFGQDFVGIPVTSSISGQVTEADDTPIPGVTLTFTGSYSTTTDLAGQYFLGGLPAGSYTIIPSKVAYNFTPGFRSVTLPPNAIGQDFVGQTFWLFLPFTVK